MYCCSRMTPMHGLVCLPMYTATTVPAILRKMDPLRMLQICLLNDLFNLFSIFILESSASFLDLLINLWPLCLPK